MTKPSPKGSEKSSYYTDDLSDVIKKERDYIKNRREKAEKELSETSGNKVHKSLFHDTDLAKDNAIGLTFSGGGIRSASFNLGITQTLAKYGILPWVDYLWLFGISRYPPCIWGDIISKKRSNLLYEYDEFKIATQYPDSLGYS